MDIGGVEIYKFQLVFIPYHLIFSLFTLILSYLHNHVPLQSLGFLLQVSGV